MLSLRGAGAGQAAVGGLAVALTDSKKDGFRKCYFKSYIGPTV